MLLNLSFLVFRRDEMSPQILLPCAAIGLRLPARRHRELNVSEELLGSLNDINLHFGSIPTS